MFINVEEHTRKKEIKESCLRVEEKDEEGGFSPSFKIIYKHFST